MEIRNKEQAMAEFSSENENHAVEIGEVWGLGNIEEPPMEEKMGRLGHFSIYTRQWWILWPK